MISSLTEIITLQFMSSVVIWQGSFMEKIKDSRETLMFET